MQFDFISSSQYLLGVRGLQEKCALMLSFSEEICQVRCIGDAPISLCMWAYGEMELSRLPPAEGPWGLKYSYLAVTGEGLS